MSFFKFKREVYPLIALLSSFYIVIFGLIRASKVSTSYFLLGLIIFISFFGVFKVVIKIIPVGLIISFLFGGIIYLITKDVLSGITMINRLMAIFVAMTIGISITPTRMISNLNQIKTPRVITLGMLMSMSFMPLLKLEIKRVKEAMKTRGANNIFNPKVFYRAFIVPFVIRLINISDTMALSVETRGFTFSKNYTIYHKYKVILSDILYILIIVVSSLLVVFL